MSVQVAINTYEVWCQKNPWDEEWCKQEVQAATPGKAKYSYWNYLQDGLWEESFEIVMPHLRCRKVGSFKVSDLFGSEERFQQVCKSRNLPFAYQGMRVEVDGQKGTIVGGNNSGNLDICFDGKWWGENCHPWWRTKYFDKDGNLIKEYGD